MAKTTTRAHEPARTTPTKLEMEQRRLDDVRKLKQIERRIAAEARAVERATKSADQRVSEILADHVERLGLVLVDRATWDRIRDEHTEYKQRVTELEEQAQRQNDLMTAASSR